jgi:energy-coupling factor transporter transmembrane protein EcfT
VYIFAFLILVVFWLLGGMMCLWLATLAGFRRKLRVRESVAIFFLGPLVLFLVLIFIGWANSQVKPTRGEILGDYRVDRNFYPGEQADWQHEIYSLKITEDWVEVKDARTEKVWREEIDWVAWSEYRWRFQSEPRHHMIRGGPAIVREKLGYYYYFESPLYGVVRFRKVGATMKLKILTGLGFLSLAGLCFYLVKFFEEKCIRS